MSLRKSLKSGPFIEEGVAYREIDSRANGGTTIRLLYCVGTMDCMVSVESNSDSFGIFGIDSGMVALDVYNHPFFYKSLCHAAENDIEDRIIFDIEKEAM